MENVTWPLESLPSDNPPGSARSLGDGDEEGAPGLAYLAFVDRSLHQAEGLRGDVLGDGRTGNTRGGLGDRPLSCLNLAFTSALSHGTTETASYGRTYYW